MNKKLPVTLRLLLELLPGFQAGSNRAAQQKINSLRALFSLAFLLMSVSGFSQLPTETFESGIPGTWAQINNGVGTTPFTISTDGYMSSGAAYINPQAENIGSGNTARYYLITPLVTMPANAELRFFTKQYDVAEHGNIYEIRVSTASQTDISSYTTVPQTWTESQLNTVTPLGYEEKVVDLSGIPAGLNVYIAFVLVNNQPGAAPDADTWLIDNVSVQSAQVCDPVVAANFQATNITANGATLNWTHPTATNFEIQVVPNGSTPAATGTPTGNSYNASGLLPNTAYSAYIKTICSASQSGWAGPFNFTTTILGVACNTPIVIPDDGGTYTFSGNLNTFNNPGGATYTTQGSNCLPAGITQNYLNGSKAYFSYTPTADGLITLTHLINTPSSNDYASLLVYEGCANVGVECIGGTFNTTEGVLKVIPNLFVQAGTTYIIVVSSQLSATASISFTFTLNSADCPAPASFTYSHLLQNSVSFSWNNTNNLMSNWQYAAVPAGSGAPATGTATTTNIDNAVTGLTAGTAYDLYVRSVCSGTPGPWSLPYRFKTQCDVFPSPYATAFLGTSATVPEPCWTSVDINGDNLTWTYLGSYATIQTSTYPDSNNDLLVSPQVDLTGGQKRIRFKDRSTGGVSSYSIKLSTTGIGATEFTTVIMPETQITNTGFIERIFYLPNISGPVNIAFVVTPGTGSVATRISIDDFFIEDAPACPDPMNLGTGTITTTTAELTWAPGFMETQWEVIVQPAGTGVPAGSGTLTSNNTSYLADNLEHSTQYEYYVRAYCNSTEQSAWVGPFVFITACGTFDVPFFEDFDNDTGTHRFCWTPLNINNDNLVFQAFSASVTDARIQRSSFGAPPASFDDWIISPAINVIGTKELKFDYKAMAGVFFPTPRMGVEVLMSTTDTDPASFSVIMPLMNFTNIDFIEKALYINANGPVYIAFRVPPSFDTSLGVSGLQIDNVRINDAPACPDPSLLSVTDIAVNSAQVHWTEGFIETQWQVAVQPQGTGLPATGVMATATTFDAASLTPDTYYEVYVRAYCNDTDQSEWIGPVTFKTLCEAYPTPFLETFEPDSATEQCWIIRNYNGDVNHFTLNGTTNPYQGAESAGMFTGSNGDNNDWLISPTLTVTSGQRLRYYYRVNDSFFEEDLEVLLSQTGIEPADFTQVLYTTDTDTNPLNNTEWREKVINLPAGVTGNINIAFHIPEETPSPAGYRGQLIAIDNFIIEDTPACSPPTNLTVQNITDAQVQLRWDSTGTETEWDIYVQPAGLGAPVGDGDPQYLSTVTTNPATVNGLTAATQYEYYVRAVCSDTEETEWVGPFTFITMCPLATACEYTFTITNPSAGGLSGEVQVIQNGQVITTLYLVSSAAGATNTYTAFLCDGVEYSLLWDGIGTIPGNSATVQITIAQGTQTVWTSPAPFGPMNDIVYEGFASCSTVTCPQPTNLSVDESGTLTWTAGGSETQWEVFIQPLGNNTLPQSGIVVNTASYTPSDSDFNSLTDGTYEFFVRAVCGSGDNSFWSGPEEFVRNDSSANAIVLPVNSGEICQESAAKASFYGATASAEPMTCAGNNNGDIWYEFVATSTAHIVELTDFSGYYYSDSGNPLYPNVILTLYHVNGTDLEEMSCSNNNAIVAAYSTATVVGETYKVRLTLNSGTSDRYTFGVCVKTPNDLCAIDAVNGSFENPDALFGFLYNRFWQEVVPGWRYNITGEDAVLFIDSYNALGISAYEGGQLIQMLTPQAAYDPADMVNIQGLFQDFDSSEITQYNYGFAAATRFDGNILQVFAGPPAGPFVLLEEINATNGWQYIEGTYDVPAGQDETRFVFRPKDNGIGIILDAVSITANNEIITDPATLDCTEDSMALEARGTGTWSADAGNPSEVTFTDASSNATTVSGLIASGDYTFYWNTRYCENSIVITNVAVDDVPAVTTPVEYCQDATATPLTAPALANHTLAWYTDPVGGTALTGAPTPVTTTPGTTSYYVAYVNDQSCEGQRAQIDVVVNPTITPETGFSYDAAAYCIAGPDPVITLNADFTTGGTFTAVPAGLAIDPATGAIDFTASTAGTYDVTYNLDAVDCTLAGSTTVNIIVNPETAATVTFTYTTPVCLDATAPVVPALETGFTAGGTFTSSTLTVDPATGEVDMTTATAGMHDITYTIAANATDCVAAGSYTFQLELLTPTVPVTDFTFAASYCIADTNPTPTPGAGFYTGGTYTATAGLFIDPVTGEINLLTSQAGTYDVTYTVAAAPCVAAAQTTVSVTITPLTAAVTGFSYQTPACINSGTTLPATLADGFTAGGLFTSATLDVDAATGEIDLTTATAGSHDIVYTLDSNAASCTDGGTFTFTVELLPGTTPVTVFSYEDAYCYGSANAVPQPATGFTAGGMYTATGNLIIDPVTGEINIADSAPGSYDVTYTVAADAATCNTGGTYTTTVTLGSDLSIVVTQECRGQEVWLLATAVMGELDDNASITWTDANGMTVASGNAEINISQYVTADELPANFTATATSGDCSSSTTYTVTSLMCQIPRGISPNGDGDNDTFDLTDFGVTQITIFNRYGREVFSYKGNYTNQWHGQDKGNGDLPDGTYFYSLTTNGQAVTGWVYISREY